MKKAFGISAAHANCETCDWKYQGKNALGLAAIHGKKHKHKVDVDHIVSGYFDYRK